MEGIFTLLIHPCLADRYGMDVIQEALKDAKELLSVSLGRYMQGVGAKSYDDIKDMDDFFDFVEDSICLSPFVDEFSEDLNISICFTKKQKGFEGKKIMYISFDSYTDVVPSTTLDVDKHYDLFDRSECIN